MNKLYIRFLSSLLLIALLLQPPMATSVQRSKGLIGRRQVLIINNSGRLLWLEAWPPGSYRQIPLGAGGDVILENVKIIRVGGTAYTLEFKNRYALLWDDRSARAYVKKLIMD